MNAAEVIRELEQGPRQIKVKCPNDHFIATITLSVSGGRLATRWGRSGKDLRRRASQGKPALYGDVVVQGDKNVVLKCRDSHCDYDGCRNAQLLALELANAALRGHTEYCLTF